MEQNHAHTKDETRLVEENMGLVRQAAHRWSKTGLPYDDVHQEGSIGLLFAARNFNPEMGMEFSTYAVRCIDGYIAKSRRKLVDGAHLLPFNLEEKRASVRRQMAAMNAEGLDADAEVISRDVGLPVNKVKAIIESMNNTVAFDMSDGDGLSLAERLSDPGAEVAEELRLKQLEELLTDRITEVARATLASATSKSRASAEKKLAKQQRIAHIVVERYINRKTLDDVGSELGLTRERVRQLENQGIAMLKTDEMREYLTS